MLLLMLMLLLMFNVTGWNGGLDEGTLCFEAAGRHSQRIYDVRGIGSSRYFFLNLGETLWYIYNLIVVA